MVAVAEVLTSAAVHQVFEATTVRLVVEFHSVVRAPDRVATERAVQKTRVYVILDGLDVCAIKKCHIKENKNHHHHLQNHQQHTETATKRFHQGIQQNPDGIVRYCENELNIKKY